MQIGTYSKIVLVTGKAIPGSDPLLHISRLATVTQERFLFYQTSKATLLVLHEALLFPTSALFISQHRRFWTQHRLLQQLHLYVSDHHIT